ncbi:MAG: polysaccharide pyruvyl transferase family protein [Bacteroidales bacterium]|nr:polysaccharide pyruvyl transferase family protein [Bacteroidales bacterium]
MEIVKQNIGILTFHRAHNYGAMLQAYALMHFLDTKGYSVEIIDYWPSEMREEYLWVPNFRYRNFLSRFKGLIKFLIGAPNELKRRKAFLLFVSEHLRLKKHRPYILAEQLQQLKYDVVIYGSDQIWRKHPFTLRFNSVYWGEYPIQVKKKIAYGASSNIINFDKDDYIFIEKMLKNFNAVGVRESDFARILQPYFSKSIEIVIDPVFLIDRNDWAKLISSSKLQIPRKPYLFFYHLNYNPAIIQSVENIARNYNLEIVEVRGRIFPFKVGRRYQQTASPIDFLKLLSNASIVVTNSFHGTAFSIIFEKDFFVLGAQKGAHRISNILERLGLEERMVQNLNLLAIQPINYAEINPKIKEWQNLSRQFLINAIEK